MDPFPPDYNTFFWHRRTTLARDHPRAQDECAICMSDSDEWKAIIKHCGHVFHDHCLGAWCRTKFENGENGTCPMCRSQLFTLTPATSGITNFEAWVSGYLTAVNSIHRQGPDHGPFDFSPFIGELRAVVESINPEVYWMTQWQSPLRAQMRWRTVMYATQGNITGARLVTVSEGDFTAVYDLEHAALGLVVAYLEHPHLNYSELVRKYQQGL